MMKDSFPVKVITVIVAIAAIGYMVYELGWFSDVPYESLIDGMKNLLTGE